ncbi:helix-turn-helix domain-containing protein [Sphingomonas sp. AX6]|uniref:helix-turn-helix domain-containing protein n=1 Tax=Sphingomonas sp. AX6 TaxID=2653171 RepID=UPI0012F2672B|nr:helix-turn-helix domain-containing protein [Sphingomonas sp. AX6]VXC64123.1 Helix-turn-helix domain protein [Sphingomonas sp. AX6]
MNNELFCSRGKEQTKRPHLYEDCGLDNIWLVDGFTIVHRNGEDLIEPEDVEGLHKAIARHIVCHRKGLMGREVRFIRRALDMTQGELAHRLGTGVQTVARWEKDKVNIPGPEDRLLRITTILGVTEPDAFAQLIMEMPKNLDDLDEGPERPISFKHNHFWEEAQMEAA